MESNATISETARSVPLETLAQLAGWLCQAKAARGVVIDLQTENCIAGSQITLDGNEKPLHFPAPLERICSAGAAAKIQSGSEEFESAWPFASGGATPGDAVWRYRRLAGGEFGVLYQVADEDRNGPAVLRNDPLTGLSMRDALAPLIDREIRQLKSSKKGFAVFFLDVDNFKQINDEHGHLVGDQVLQYVAFGIRHAVRPQDGAVRYGGDEFVIVIGGLHGAEESLRVAQRIGEMISGPYATDRWVPYTVSIGVAYSDASDAQPETILDRADRAMYRAKSQGRSGKIEMEE